MARPMDMQGHRVSGPIPKALTNLWKIGRRISSVPFRMFTLKALALLYLESPDDVHHHN
jgi:hypothetical protein